MPSFQTKFCAVWTMIPSLHHNRHAMNLVQNSTCENRQFSARFVTNCWNLSLQFTRTSAATLCTCAIFTVFCTSLQCEYLSQRRNWNVWQYVEELSLRHLHCLEEGLLELGLHDHWDVQTDVQRCTTSSLPSIHSALGWRCIPSGGPTRCSWCRLSRSTPQ